MCYLKPGPRCAAHARPALVKAYDNYINEPSEENLKTLNKRRNEYLETREGYKKAIPSGEVKVIEKDGSVRTIPLEEMGDYENPSNEAVKQALAEAYEEKRKNSLREWKEHLAEQEAAQQEKNFQQAFDQSDNPETFLNEDPFTQEDVIIEEETEDGWVTVEEPEVVRGTAQEPVEGEELDADGYGVISGINEAGFRRDGTHYATGDRYDEFGVDEQGWTELGINAKTGLLVDEDGYNRRGFNPKTGLHRNGTRYDEAGYNISGVDKQGWRKDGWNANVTRHKDTCNLPHPLNKYDSQGYGPDGRDAWGYSKFDGTNKYNFLPNRKYAPRQHLPPPQCYLDERGFDSAGIHHETKKRLDPKGRDRDGYDIDWMDKHGRLHPEVAPNRSTALIHTHPAYASPLVKAGLTERNGWTTNNARGTNKLFPMLVEAGYRYRNQPMRMMWEVGWVMLERRTYNKELERYELEQRKIYTTGVAGAPNGKVAFTDQDALRDFLLACGIPQAKPQGDPF